MRLPCTNTHPFTHPPQPPTLTQNRDVATGAPLPDEIHWCKFSSVAWTKDGAGFFYAKYPPPSSKGKADGAGTETEAAASQKVGR